MNDLPTSFDYTSYANSVVHVIESIGYGPQSERVVNVVNLLAADAHSDTTDPSAILLRANSDGTPTYTCERWIRLRFTPPFGLITNMRLWIDNYQPEPGWSVNWGTTDQFTTPSVDPSNVAFFPVPIADPGSSNLTTAGLEGGNVQYTPYIVLQGIWQPGTPGSIQPAALNWHLAWSEA